MMLRRLRPEDAGAVLALEEVGMTHPWNAVQIASELAFPGSLGLGAELEGQLVAFALLRVLVPECELLRIAVHPKIQRQGVGTQLLHKAFAEAGALACETCFLEVRTGNAPALALYAALGFEQDGIRKNYYNHPVEDAVLLHKNLQGDGKNEKSA